MVNKKNGGKGRARSVIAREREAECIKLRKLGMSYEAIGDRLSVSRSTAHKHTMNALATIREETQEVARDVIEIEIQRLDELTLTYLPRAMKGDEKAASLMLKVMERRAKLLGLDAPTKQETNTKITFDDEAIRAELATRTPGYARW